MTTIQALKRAKYPAKASVYPGNPGEVCGECRWFIETGSTNIMGANKARMEWEKTGRCWLALVDFRGRAKPEPFSPTIRSCARFERWLPGAPTKIVQQKPQQNTAVDLEDAVAGAGGQRGGGLRFAKRGAPE